MVPLLLADEDAACLQDAEHGVEVAVGPSQGAGELGGGDAWLVAHAAEEGEGAC